MTSFLVVCLSKEKRQKYIQAFASAHMISHFDVSVVQKDENSKNLQSLGVEDVRTLQKKLFLKPMQSKEKAVVLDDAQLLTIEAQNALLKVLEEPPNNTYIFLSAETKEVFLPTVLSRCQIIELEEPRPLLTSEEEKEFVQFLIQIKTMKVGDRLKRAESLAKEKEKTLVWLEKLILTARAQMMKTPNPTRAQYYVDMIKQFQTLYMQLKTTNVNIRFAIEQTLLTL